MSGRSDLVVNYELLDTSVKQLRKLHQEFKELEDHGDDMHDHFGAYSIKQAMSDFYGNWEHYRKKLLEDIQNVEGKARAARKGFKKTDHDLAEEHKKGDK